MTGHGDHGRPEEVQAVMDQEMLDRFRMDSLRNAEGLNPKGRAIPLVKFLRNTYGLGLKEAKDAHDAMIRLTDPTWLAGNEYSRDLVSSREVKAMHDRLAYLEARVASFERDARLREIDEALVDLERDREVLLVEREGLRVPEPEDYPF